MIPEISQPKFPTGPELDKLLKLKNGLHIEELVKQNLGAPLQNLFDRPRKKIRGQMVELAFDLSDASERPADKTHLCLVAADAIESIHAGSLVVDDIQDGSATRRGKPTLHLSYGLPVALNAGNWLYFWPFETIRRLEVSGAKKLALYQACHTTLLRAHYGQALDVGTPVDQLEQSQIYDICLASIELKSGALVALAMQMGAIMADSSPDRVDVVDRFGHRFGIALQMFDDVGNLTSSRDPLKKWEDLMLRRPSWLWAVAAREFSSGEFERFVSAVRQLGQDTSPLEAWLEDTAFRERAHDLAKRYLEDALSFLAQEIPLNQARPVLDWGKNLARAYG